MTFLIGVDTDTKKVYYDFVATAEDAQVVEHKYRIANLKNIEPIEGVPDQNTVLQEKYFHRGYTLTEDEPICLSCE